MMPVRAARTAPVVGVPVYRVSLRTPAGPAELEVPSCAGAATARRRAIVTAAALGWGEPPVVQVTGTELLPDPRPAKSGGTLIPAATGQLMIRLRFANPGRTGRSGTARTD
jgi:hypothetical protein